MRRAAITATGLALMLGGAAQARQPSEVERRYTGAYSACLSHGDAAQGVTVAMRDCNDDELVRQNVALNAAYRSAMARRTTAQRENLRAQERVWIKQRDKLGQQVDGDGTDGLLISDGCYLDETIRRTIWLEKLR